jgi:tRNA G37 N-methylase Trm5
MRGSENHHEVVYEIQCSKVHFGFQERKVMKKAYTNELLQSMFCGVGAHE